MIHIKQHNKAWIGIGISNSYISILDHLKRILSEKNFSEVLIIIADKIDNKYNNHYNTKLEQELFETANRIELKECKIKVVRWEYLRKNNTYLKILEEVKHLFNSEFNFKKDVQTLVIKNRKNYKNKSEINLKAGYVLEEIGSTVFFNKNGYIKIGPEKQEKPFDNLSIKWFNLNEADFKRF